MPKGTPCPNCGSLLTYFRTDGTLVCRQCRGQFKEVSGVIKVVRKPVNPELWKQGYSKKEGK